METRVAVMGIILDTRESAEQLNSILHDYGDFIIGRMGIPYKPKNINIVSIASSCSPAFWAVMPSTGVPVPV